MARTFELTSRTCDLAAAPGVSADVPQVAVADTFAVIGALAAVQETASAALLASTGRHPLPAGYSVLWQGLGRSPVSPGTARCVNTVVRCRYVVIDVDDGEAEVSATPALRKLSV